MCALAHYIEAQGIATVVISLLRDHSDFIAPPRALFVPFELGRPLGNPHDISGQAKVLSQALALLNHSGPGPVLRDYLDPVKSPSADFRPPFQLPKPVNLTAAALRIEVEALLPTFNLRRAKTGRSVFGNSGLSPEACVDLIAAALDTGQGKSTRISSKILRFAIDDLKTLYFEAACLDTTGLASAPLNQWFWRTTLAAQAIVQLRHQSARSDDRSRQMIANFMVPGEWVDLLGL